MRQFVGPVIRGNGRATAVFGVPTANILVSQQDGPPPGVYAGLSQLDGQEIPSAICVRQLTNDQMLCEVHLLDWGGDLYGKRLAVDLKELVSDCLQLASEEETKKKILADLERVRYVFRHHSTPRSNPAN